MTEGDLDFQAWWWLDQERKRLARSKRVRASRRQLAETILFNEAAIRQLESELALRRRPLPQRPVARTAALVRALGLDGKVLQRNFVFQREMVNENNRTVSLTVSSDAPLERSFGVEVLSHSPDHVDLTRLTKAGALLFNHDPMQHLGRITSCRTDGHKLHVTARFGNSALAREKYEDIVSGILRETSIGYQVDSMVEGPRGTFTATRWCPYEASAVTIPADLSVGISKT